MLTRREYVKRSVYLCDLTADVLLRRRALALIFAFAGVVWECTIRAVDSGNFIATPYDTAAILCIERYFESTARTGSARLMEHELFLR